MKLRKLYTGNVVYGELPKGCKLCLRGLKTVVFVTGLCPRDCFYCPLSAEKRGRDVFYVNERTARRAEDVVAEVLSCGSRGVGVTGGDPLVRLDRTTALIKAVKEFFGESFHVHLYTSGKTLTSEVVRKLEEAGLDEMRLHPDARDVDRVLRTIEESEPGFQVGFEIPMLPDAVEGTLRLLEKLALYESVSFVNINELEFSESNSEELRARGYKLADDWRSAEGSREAALRVLEEVSERGLSLNVHFCPAASKDRYQFRLRLYRRGTLTAMPHELVSDGGTLLKALISESCENAPPLLVFRGRLGYETSVLAAEVFGANYQLLEELPDSSKTLLNIT